MRLKTKRRNELDQLQQRLAELVIALNEWISKGGFLPDAWRQDAKVS